MIEVKYIWKRILPNNSHFRCGRLSDVFLPLTNLERASLGIVSDRRLTEMKAGRTLAKRALLSIGILDVDIIKDRLTGAPIWPESIAGSITHTCDSANSHVAVAVAKKNEIPFLGIDAELGGNIHPSLWKMFLSEEEFMWVNTQSELEKPLLIRKVWALKEAAIKACGNLDMLSWRVSQKIMNSEIFELNNDGACGVKFLAGKAVCYHNITLAVVYAI